MKKSANMFFSAIALMALALGAGCGESGQTDGSDEPGTVSAMASPTPAAPGQSPTPAPTPQAESAPQERPALEAGAALRVRPFHNGELLPDGGSPMFADPPVMVTVAPAVVTVAPANAVVFVRDEPFAAGDGSDFWIPVSRTDGTRLFDGWMHSSQFDLSGFRIP